ncbi:patatin-like phospholipase family protein [Clostridium sporogenes]|uniref:patatin-like phospholipase family protein n=1 Tax=Clostridium sporogenes TaxID=1509 RepID=UPI0005F07E6D|nr:patatin-like phospholipase family protein [Clostridium sporogenes]MCW6094393.1 patatin-like phospholipase family protein [Clostridium sporogenes]NFG97279.1 phospholipase [Clostridium sporogenes]NFH32487.1 phospholipase [Clostridium sporogenes]NFL20721.1 phospholipase [Clostridium sporogenes]NFL74160.1 phospholipase [Clostridium sporogenes]
MKCNAVLDSGGIRGIGTIGALNHMESKGFTWNNIAGTSVGALIGALLVSGYTARDLKHITVNMDFMELLNKEGIQKSTFVGRAMNFFKFNGVYSGDFIEKWIDDMLKVKGINTFSDLMNNGTCRLKIIASDITEKRKVTFPDDLYSYGFSLSNFRVSKAIRMSISIPFFFKPIRFIHGNGLSYIVDGGVCCAYPISIFDNCDNKDIIPTIGFKFDNIEISNTKQGKSDPLSFLFDIADTMNKKDSKEWMTNKNIDRTILIPTLGISSTDFNLSKEKTLKLYKSGYRSAEKFIKTWDFEEYKNKYKEEGSA